MLKRFICKMFGHKKGFYHKDHDIYFYRCPRCHELVWEEVIYDER